MAARIRIARAGVEDREAAIDLLGRQLAEHRIETAAEAISAAVDGMMKDDRLGFLLVAKERPRVVGVAYVSFVWALEHGGRSCWLEELYVLPERRGVGVGTKLLAAVLERAKRRGCATVDLEVDREHGRAARLYARHGFRPLPRSRWVRGL